MEQHYKDLKLKAIKSSFLIKTFFFCTPASRLFIVTIQVYVSTDMILIYSKPHNFHSKKVIFLKIHINPNMPYIPEDK